MTAAISAGRVGHPLAPTSLAARLKATSVDAATAADERDDNQLKRGGPSPDQPDRWVARDSIIDPLLLVPPFLSLSLLPAVHSRADQRSLLAAGTRSNPCSLVAFQSVALIGQRRPSYLSARKVCVPVRPAVLCPLSIFHDRLAHYRGPVVGPTGAMAMKVND